jgi:uncharacterized OB-fold protein
MGSEKWDVIVDNIPGERERSFLCSIMHRANPQLDQSEIEPLPGTPMVIGTALSFDAANALMRELGENGIPCRKRRLAKEATAESSEDVQHASEARYCTRCGAPLMPAARYCTRCGARAPGIANSSEESTGSGSALASEAANHSLAEQEKHNQETTTTSITPTFPSKPLLSAYGYKGSVELYPDRIRILRDIDIPGLRGESEIPLSSIASVQLRDISIAGNGIIQFLSPGEAPLGNAILALLADNALTFNKKHRDAFVEFAKAANIELGKRPEGTIIKIRPCRDCGRDVSVHASSCPHCGAPAPMASPEVIALAQKVEAKIATVKVATSGLSILIWAAVALFFLYVFFRLW